MKPSEIKALQLFDIIIKENEKYVLIPSDKNGYDNFEEYCNKYQLNKGIVSALMLQVVNVKTLNIEYISPYLDTIRVEKPSKEERERIGLKLRLYGIEIKSELLFPSISVKIEQDKLYLLRQLDFDDLYPDMHIWENYLIKETKKMIYLYEAKVYSYKETEIIKEYRISKSRPKKWYKSLVESLEYGYLNIKEIKC